jgi:hypothetical protein
MGRGAGAGEAGGGDAGGGDAGGGDAGGGDAGGGERVVWQCVWQFRTRVRC